jgi:hypothetical protein
MSGLMIPNCAESEVVDPFCERLAIALKELKVRLQAKYERRFPGKGFRIQKAIEETEVAAWGTPFPHLFLPDLAEEAIARSVGSLSSELGDETV